MSGEYFTAEEVLREVLMDRDSGGESDFELDSDPDYEAEEIGVVDDRRAIDIERVDNHDTGNDQGGEPARKRVRTVGDDGSMPGPSGLQLDDVPALRTLGNDGVALGPAVPQLIDVQPVFSDEESDDESDDDDGADGDNDDQDDNGNNQLPRPRVRQPRWHGIERGAYKEDQDIPWLQPFTERCGVLHHNNEARPEEICDSLLGKETIQHIVRETNRYAKQFFDSIGGKGSLPRYSSAKNWKDVNDEDIRAFIGLVLLMGIIQLPTYSLYWSNCWLLNLGMKAVISRDRFLLILRFLHCANNEEAAPRNDPRYDRIFKIRGLLDLVISNWQEQYYPRREITGDETIIPFKGTTTLKGYNPQKPHKWGLTVWSLAESETGYVYNWNLYEGKKNDDDRTKNNDGKGKVHWVTWDLLESANVLGKNHHFYCDNYFTSPTLFEDLANQQTGACGTLRRNRIGVPDTIKQAKPAKTDPAVLAESGKCTYFSWQDRNLVSLISTVHTTEAFMKRTRAKNTESGWQEREKPKAIECYTKYMRGVDLADQAMWYSLNTHKSVKWWKKVFVALLEVCMCNALVIYRELNPDRKIERNKFRLHVITMLIGGYTNRGTGGVQRGPIVHIGDDDDLGQLARALLVRFQPGPHFSEFNPDRTPSGNRSKPRCIVCSSPDKRVQTVYQCQVCLMPMCPAPCMARFHTIEVSWKKPRAEMDE